MYLIKKKSEVFARFKAWRAEVGKEMGQLVKCLRSDNGGKYTSLEFKRYYKENDIKHCYTIKMTPQQNVVMEKINQTLIEKVRSLRLQASLPKSFGVILYHLLIFMLIGLPIDSLIEDFQR